MFRNSSEKSSISAANIFIRVLKWLYASTAGIAANNPAAVAISASEMLGPTTARFVEPVVPMR